MIDPRAVSEVKGKTKLGRKKGKEKMVVGDPWLQLAPEAEGKRKREKAYTSVGIYVPAWECKKKLRKIIGRIEDDRINWKIVEDR